jgi:hypothetical protein
MGNMRVLAIILMTIMALPGGVLADQITPLGISGTGTYYHSAGLIIDNDIPPEWTHWQNEKCVWWVGTAPSFIVDLGKIYRVQGLLLQVDNNDDYKVRYSVNNSSWSDLITVSQYWGNVSSCMDTFTL